MDVCDLAVSHLHGFLETPNAILAIKKGISVEDMIQATRVLDNGEVIVSGPPLFF